jgi:hypothetical protein
MCATKRLPSCHTFCESVRKLTQHKINVLQFNKICVLGCKRNNTSQLFIKCSKIIEGKL